MKIEDKHLKELQKFLESEKSDRNIFDIIIYGSAVKGKTPAKSVSVMVIFREGTLKQRLDRIKDIKENSKDIKLTIDFKQALLEDLFSTVFFARTNILVEGVSVFRHRGVAEILGFKPFTLFWYSLKNLNHSQKVRFNYVLAGRNTPGMIEQLGGERLVRGAVKIPMEKSAEFEEVLKRNKIEYHKKDVLESS